MIRRAAGGISFSVYDRLPLVSCLLRLIWYDSGSDHRLNLALRALPEHRSVAGRVELRDYGWDEPVTSTDEILQYRQQ